MMGTTTIRQAVENDIPHLIALGEIQYNLFHKPGQPPYNIEMAHRYTEAMMYSQTSVVLIIEDHTRIPFGYISGGIDYLYMTGFPEAVSHNWFVHNPNQQYGKNNYGLELLKAFEKWAEHHGCKTVRISMSMMPKQKRVFDRVFKKLNYEPTVVLYTKEME